MDISFLTFDQSESFRTTWDAFVQAHPSAARGHLSAVFYFSNPAANHSLIAVDDHGAVVGILPLFEVEDKELRGLPYRRLVSAGEFPAGPLLAGNLPARVRRNVLDAMLDKVRGIAAARKADEVSIAYPLIDGDRTSLETYGYYPLRHYAFQEENRVVLLLDLTVDEKQLFSNLDSNCRNAIKRCMKSGAVVRKIDTREEWLSCYDLNVKTLGAHADSREHMAIIWDHFVLAGLADVLAVVSDGVIVTVVVTVRYKSAYYWKSYRDRDRNVIGANNLGLWQGILDAQTNGCRFFELGGMEFANTKQVAISSFKESFGGRPVYQLAGRWVSRPLRRAWLDMGRAGVEAFRERRRSAAP